MFAVVKTGGKQYRVALDDLLEVERLPGEAGTAVDLKEVLMVGDGSDVKVGAPFVAGVTVSAEIIEQTRGDKVLIFKKKRRHHYRRHGGHRQDLTLLQITGIGDVKSDKPKATKKAKVQQAPKADKAKASKPKAEKKAAPKKTASKAAAKSTEKKPAAKKKAPAKKTEKKAD